jgi:4-amino-4-deoxy-L-arabinose transferase-like glycosyltransferase
MRTVLVLLPAALLIFLVVSVSDTATTRKLFVETTYYFLFATVLCWAGTYLYTARDLRRAAVLSWAKENWPGLLIALLVTVLVGLSVDPALRMLSDEANLVGTSKNFFASKTATFTVSGKNYYGSYWDVDVAIDRRPTLFPFLVSLVHTVCGYSYENVFTFNLLVLPAFLLVAYRLAKSLGGETFAIAASLLVAAHPVTLISIRSGGFDFFTAFFGLLVIKSLLDFIREQSADCLAIVWMNACLFAEIRYETALFIPPVVALLLLFRMIDRSKLRPYALLYALTPVFLLPRLWQSILRGNVPEQAAGTITFSVDNFLDNAHEYFKPLLSPSQSYPFHSAIVIALGAVGCLIWLCWLAARLRAKQWRASEVKFALFVALWMLVQVVIVFSYVWGRAQFPSAARLVIAIDTFFSFAAAWLLSRWLARFRPFVTVLSAAALFAIALPVASRHQLMNRLTQTRESATTWRFFERLGEKRILIVTDRPSHFTIMDYGSMSFEAARRDTHLFTALARRLIHDVYVIQQIRLSTNEVLPGYDIWPDRRLEAVLEFQNDADILVRVSRLAR